jgi:3-oxoacyl-[acyl-carrier-protein] synthase-3
MNIGSKILAFGKALPKKVVTNFDLESLMDTSDDWITQRTGIKERRVADESIGENSTTLAAAAAKSCFEQAKKLNPEFDIKPSDIDLIICSTATSDNLFPSTACMVQPLLGIESCAGFDISAACTGFIYALNIADTFIKSGQYKNVLVLSVDLMSRYVDWSDRRTAVIFGDGAGAVLLTAVPEADASFKGFYLNAKADKDQALYLKNTRSHYPVKAEDIDTKPEMVSMNGQAVYQFAVKALPESIEQACAKANINPSSIDWVVPHQANYRILESAAKRFNLPMEKFICNIEKYGNTSSASIPIAFHEAIEEGRIVKNGKKQTIAMAGFGAGMTWGAAVIEF